MKRGLSTPNIADETPMRVRSKSAGASAFKNSGSRNLFRQSMFGTALASSGRPSCGPSIRRSSALDSNKKDIRTQTGKESHQRNLKSIFDFMQHPEHKFPYTISAKMQTGPTAKEVTQMFEFIIKVIMIDFEMGNNKFEDEFPRLLKMLGFPYPVVKRNVQPVASLHNWPLITYGLAWLCSAATYMNNLQRDPLVLQGDNNDYFIMRQVNTLNEKMYIMYMNDEEDLLEETSDRFFAELPSLVGGVDEADELEELRRKLFSLEEELARLLQDKETAQATLNSLRNDILLLEGFLEKIDIFIASREFEDRMLKDQQEKLVTKVEDLRASIKTKEQIVKDQLVSPEDIKQLAAQLKSLISQVAVCRETLKRARQDIVDKEEQLMKIREKVLSNIDEYHTATSTCHLTPASAANAQGHDYAIHATNFDADVESAGIQATLGRLNLILKQWKEATRETKTSEMQDIENLTLMEQSLATKLVESSEMEAEVQRQSESIELTKQEQAKELGFYHEELTTVERECNNNRKATIVSGEEIEILQKEVKLKSAALSQQRANRDDEISKAQHFMITMCKMMLEHKMTITNMMLQLEQDVKRFGHNWRSKLSGAVQLTNVPSIAELNTLIQEVIEMIETLDLENEVESV